MPDDNPSLEDMERLQTLLVKPLIDVLQQSIALEFLKLQNQMASYAADLKALSNLQADVARLKSNQFKVFAVWGVIAAGAGYAVPLCMARLKKICGF